jgi:hypothetical protein
MTASCLTGRYAGGLDHGFIIHTCQFLPKVSRERVLKRQGSECEDLPSQYLPDKHPQQRDIE